MSVYPEGVRNPTQGLFAGRAGVEAKGTVQAADGALIKDCGTGELVTLSGNSDVVEVILAGGSGYGDPSTRDRAKLADDVADGYVSAEAAVREYCFNPGARAAE